MDDVRWEKVLKIRRAIERGAYVTEVKLEKAVDRLLGEELMTNAEAGLDERHLRAMLGRSTCQPDPED